MSNHSIRSSIILLLFFMLLGCSGKNTFEWNEQEGYRWANLNTSMFGKAGFEKIPPRKTGIQVNNSISREMILENRHLLNGSGVAVADVDNDGLIDIYFATLDGPNKLYKNLGNYTFRDITTEAGVAHEGYESTGVTFADVNGNGFQDLIITSLTQQNVIYLNNGEGNFTIHSNSGLGKSNGGNTITAADINGNGYLDLYISNYKPQSVKSLFSASEIEMENTVEIIDGNPTVIPPFDEHYGIFNDDGNPIRVELGSSDELYLNNGDGTFSPADDKKIFLDPEGDPMGLQRDWGLSATFRDITGNSLPDLYVANDFWTPDRLWINQGDGTFRLMDYEMINNLSFSSMGVDFSDINRNGHTDIVVTEMLSNEHTLRLRQTAQHLSDEYGRPLYNRNSVYLNRGDQTFAQIAYLSGLEASGWSWATVFLDINLNGYEDLLIANGYAFDYIDMDTQFMLNEQLARGMLPGDDDILQYPSLKLQNKLFENQGDLTFRDMSSSWGFNELDITMGVALADLNNNGTPDLIMNRFNDEAIVYRNRSNNPRIAVRLKGNSPNTAGIGAKIELEGGPVYQVKEMIEGGIYLSGSQNQVVFAANKNSSHTLTVTWRSGKKSVIEGVQENRIYEVFESGAEPAETIEDIQVNDVVPLFDDVSDKIGHFHEENDFNDFQLQPLLPIQLSRLGPGVAWVDVTRNGHNDLIIGSAKDGMPALFENRGDGEFALIYEHSMVSISPGDQTTLLSWKEDDYQMVVIGSANYEQGSYDVPSAYLYSISPEGDTNKINIPWSNSATGAMAAADINNNGRIDLFSGGRFIPGNYPQNATSRIYLNLNDTYRLDQQNAELLNEIGLITGAVFSDLNQNGQQDLILSTEWGSIKVLQNRNGIFRDISTDIGLDRYKGWWRGVATGDFTNNGYPDIVAANIGLNSAYQIRNDKELRLFYDDLNWDGRLNIIDSYYEEEIVAYVPRRRLHDFSSIPTILQQVQSHTEFAQSSVDTIFDTDFNTVPYKSINTLEHMIFINHGDRFEARPLPIEAQFSAGYHVGVADVNNNGIEDLFLSMNDYSFPEYIPRLDAGRGLILLGDGNGNFTPLSGAESGIKIYGEQRGAAFSDFDRDGRVDLAVAQNNGPTKLYKNRTERPGIVVELIGGQTNGDAIGSKVRLIYEDGTKGPVREIQAGSGYWSQNSKEQVLGFTKKPVAIEVKWYDGTLKTTPLEQNELFYSIEKALHR